MQTGKNMCTAEMYMCMANYMFVRFSLLVKNSNHKKSFI